MTDAGAGVRRFREVFFPSVAARCGRLLLAAGSISLALGGHAAGVPLSGTIDLATVGVTTPGVQIDGFSIPNVGLSEIGRAVSSAGDVNDDGFDDLLLGSPLGSFFPYPSEAFLVYGAGHLAAPSGRINLSDLGTTFDGARFQEDENIADQLVGRSVAPAGDVDGDGIDDFLISAARRLQGFESRTNPTAHTYLVYGQDGANAFSGTFGLAGIGTTIPGARFDGFYKYPFSVDLAISSAGDFNGDGLADLVLGEAGGHPIGLANSGETYLIYGQDGSDVLSGVIDVATVGDTIAGVRFQGRTEQLGAGRAVSSAGDVNGDGIDDLLIGTASGSTYLIYGRGGAETISGTVDLALVGHTTAGVLFQSNELDHAGYILSAAGDVNGDGLADLLISAPGAAPDGLVNVGAVSLIYGQSGANELTGTIDLATVGGVTAGARFEGAADRDNVSVVSAAGDFNGDGLDDILIGAPGVSTETLLGAGAAYLIFGQRGADTLSGVFSLDAVGDSIAGVTFLGTARSEGSNEGEFAGVGVAGAGDVNGDGADDLLIGSVYTLPPGFSGGRAYVVYGHAVPEPSTVVLVGMGLLALLALRRCRRGE